MAQRCRIVGGNPRGSLSHSVENSRLEEDGDSVQDTDAMLRSLLSDHEKIIRYLRGDVDVCGKLGDEGTKSFLIETMAAHEAMALALRSGLGLPGR